MLKKNQNTEPAKILLDPQLQEWHFQSLSDSDPGNFIESWFMTLMASSNKLSVLTC